LRTKLPYGVSELLKDRVDSFEKLELVIALHDAKRTTLSVEELSRRLTLTRETIRRLAIELRSASLVALNASGDVQLLPPTSGEDTAVADLVRLYREDRFTLVAAIGEIAVSRLRGMTARAFADAFVIRRKPKKDGEDA
jgi:hypothetical protein